MVWLAKMGSAVESLPKPPPNKKRRLNLRLPKNPLHKKKQRMPKPPKKAHPPKPPKKAHPPKPPKRAHPPNRMQKLSKKRRLNPPQRPDSAREISPHKVFAHKTAIVAQAKRAARSRLAGKPFVCVRLARPTRTAHRPPSAAPSEPCRSAHHNAHPLSPKKFHRKNPKAQEPRETERMQMHKKTIVGWMFALIAWCSPRTSR